ncbi:hypothetical protein [Mollivirus kamchatka]|nr:hypothetical protein [Mollivirus kamchatka]
MYAPRDPQASSAIIAGTRGRELTGGTVESRMQAMREAAHQAVVRFEGKRRSRDPDNPTRRSRTHHNASTINISISTVGDGKPTVPVSHDSDVSLGRCLETATNASMVSDTGNNIDGSVCHASSRIEEFERKLDAVLSKVADTPRATNDSERRESSHREHAAKVVQELNAELDLMRQRFSDFLAEARTRLDVLLEASHHRVDNVVSTAGELVERMATEFDETVRHMDDAVGEIEDRASRSIQSLGPASLFSSSSPHNASRFYNLATKCVFSDGTSERRAPTMPVVSGHCLVDESNRLAIIQLKTTIRPVLDDDDTIREAVAEVCLRSPHIRITTTTTSKQTMAPTFHQGSLQDRAVGTVQAYAVVDLFDGLGQRGIPAGSGLVLGTTTDQTAQPDKMDCLCLTIHLSLPRSCKTWPEFLVLGEVVYSV